MSKRLRAFRLAAVWFYVGKGTYVKPGGVVVYGWVHALWGEPNKTSVSIFDCVSGPGSPMMFDGFQLSLSIITQ